MLCFICVLVVFGVCYCVGLYVWMFDLLCQVVVFVLFDGDVLGLLIVCWSLYGGFKYEQVKVKYELFDKFVDEDFVICLVFVELVVCYVLVGQLVIIMINNKVEGFVLLLCIVFVCEIVVVCVQWCNEVV